MRQPLLALLAKEPAHGYEMKLALEQTFGEAYPSPNIGQIYVTLSRLEKAGFIARHEAEEPEARHKAYELTAAGQERVAEWLAEVSWPRPDLAEFHLKLVTAAQAGLADPIGIVDAQRRELLRHLREVEWAAMAETPDSAAGLLLEGIVLRLQADLRWLEACERAWINWRKK